MTGGWRWVGWAVALGAAGWFAWHAAAAMGGANLGAYASWRAGAGLVLAGLAYACSIPLSAWAWRRVLLGMGHPVGLGALTRVLAVSQMGKYLPGNVGAHLGRVALGRALGVPMLPLAWSMGLELVLAGVAAGLVGIGGMVLAGSQSPLPFQVLAWPNAWFWLVALAAGGAGGLVLWRRRPMGKVFPGARAMGIALFVYVANYLVIGLGLWGLAWLALPGGEHHLGLLCAGFALAWMAGFLAPGVPAGLGVREAVLLAVLGTAYSSADALFIVVALRLATMGADTAVFLAGCATGARVGILHDATRPVPGAGPVIQPKSPAPPPTRNTPMELEPTGERMILEQYQSSAQDRVIYLMHEATYLFAFDLVAGKRVLDYGCGSGYGSAMLAGVAKHVHGVDVAEDAVAYARGHFMGNNLDFSVVESEGDLPFGDDCFDVVVSFQVLEHVRDEDAYMARIGRVLAPGGILILATPDRSTRLFRFQRPWNRWHVREYDRPGLESLLKRHFSQVRVMGMGGDRGVVGIELARCARMKWLSLPFTLPMWPDKLRVAMLGLVHAVRGRPGSRAGAGQAKQKQQGPQVQDKRPSWVDFDVGAITIGDHQHPSTNLVAVARQAAGKTQADSVSHSPSIQTGTRAQ